MRSLLKKLPPVRLVLETRRRWHRFRFAFSYYRPAVSAIFHWLKHSREDTNFTYELTRLNRQQLAGLIAVVTGKTITEIEGYFSELDGDEALRRHVLRRTADSPQAAQSDPHARYGRRLGWYALVRAAKPRVVVETGVDKGLGACVLASALLVNRAEGHPGAYYGTDINPAAGYLFTAPYTDCGRILYGDSIASLQTLTEPIDFFVNDSDHSAEYEGREYEAVRGKLSEHALILGDNAHVTDKLYFFAAETNRQYVFFDEKPKDHWYPGASIGIAFRPTR